MACFFVAKPFRGKGISTKLLDTAVKYARKQGAEIIEGYPSRFRGKQHDRVIYTGLPSMFLKVGFEDFGSASRNENNNAVRVRNMKTWDLEGEYKARARDNVVQNGLPRLWHRKCL